MSNVYQHRKGDERYSLKARREWWVCINQPGLPDERYPVGNKVEAQAELDRRDRALKAAQFNVILRDKLITDILDEYLSSNNFSDQDHMENVIRYVGEPFIGHQYSELTQSFYEQNRMQWKRHRKTRIDPLSKICIKSYEKIFRAAIHQYDPNCIFKQKEIKTVSVPEDDRSDRAVPDEDFLKIIQYLSSQPRVVVFLLYLRYTGIRDGAMQALPWDKIDFISQQITIPEWIGKDRTGTYTIPIDGRIFHRLVEGKLNRKKIVQEIVENLRSNNHTRFSRLEISKQDRLICEAENLIFPETILSGEAGFYHECNDAFKDACKKLNLKNYKLHGLRHAAAIEWYEKSKDIVKVCKALGHKSIKMTENYLNKKKIDSDYLFDPVKNNPCKSHLQAIDICTTTNTSLPAAPKTKIAA